jgi:AbrB family looped-hinge helix DNA binding protein
MNKEKEALNEKYHEGGGKDMITEWITTSRINRTSRRLWVTIPKEAADKMGLKEGDYIRIEIKKVEVEE